MGICCAEVFNIPKKNPFNIATEEYAKTLTLVPIIKRGGIFNERILN